MQNQAPASLLGADSFQWISQFLEKKTLETERPRKNHCMPVSVMTLGEMILQGSRLSRPAKFSKTIMEFGVATILKSQSRGLDLDMSAQTQLILLMKKIRHRLMWRIYEKFSKTSFSSHHLDNHPDSLGRILDLSISPKETKKETQRSRSMALEKAFLMLIP